MMYHFMAASAGHTSTDKAVVCVIAVFLGIAFLKVISKKD